MTDNDVKRNLKSARRRMKYYESIGAVRTWADELVYYAELLGEVIPNLKQEKKLESQS